MLSLFRFRWLAANLTSSPPERLVTRGVTLWREPAIKNSVEILKGKLDIEGVWEITWRSRIGILTIWGAQNIDLLWLNAECWSGFITNTRLSKWQS